MSLFDDLIETFPELNNMLNEFEPNGSISLRNDSDGYGDYIEKWEYPKSLPKKFKVGK